ncbi:SGNH/GDSL hydrolase family protein [Seohaeicola nanhaiensis]|uniref:SGNH/GDSL hydrolase family protein n=1 Tax=Seohaeicola nanhaiensis TaxID=1387282 RepID=A0ABV9KF28_9RHOB
MKKTIFALLGACLAVLAGCGEPTTNAGKSAHILAMGDSMLAWNRADDMAIADQVEKILGQPVIDRSVVGAHVIYQLPVSGKMGMKIVNQYRPGDWDWVILNGGGNDLWLGCGCARCEHRMDKLVARDGRSGDIVNMVSMIRATGARVVYLGYLRSPGFGSPIEHCHDEGDELDRRLQKMAAADPGVFFVPLSDLVPSGNKSFHDFDHIHPSVKGSTAIGARVAAVIEAAGPARGAN